MWGISIEIVVLVVIVNDKFYEVYGNRFPQDKDYNYVTSENETTLCCPIEDHVIYNITMRSKNTKKGCYGLPHTILSAMLNCYWQPSCIIKFKKDTPITFVKDESSTCLMQTSDVLMYNFSCIHKEKKYFLHGADVEIDNDEGLIVSHSKYPWHYKRPPADKTKQITKAYLTRPDGFNELWLDLINLDIADNDEIKVDEEKWESGNKTIVKKDVVKIKFEVGHENKFSGFVFRYKWLKNNSLPVEKSKLERKLFSCDKKNVGFVSNKDKKLLKASECFLSACKDTFKCMMALSENSGNVDFRCSREECPKALNKITGKFRNSMRKKFTIKFSKPQGKSVLRFGVKKSRGMAKVKKPKTSFTLTSPEGHAMDFSKSKKPRLVLELKSKMADDDFLCYRWESSLTNQPLICDDNFDAHNVVCVKTRKKKKGGKKSNKNKKHGKKSRKKRGKLTNETDKKRITSNSRH
ncbi:uncharacterized protein LOC126815160 isoform X3 [Patella vulgata]|uniref:uncharacterized protein LOC126815160 isoform X3 n=1 Tax=Patella vulgata TaxID=6465 RepID=UPI0021801A04|nr:uncharacterized protein LOC126815160 isoform X3 [Patella vulgata]